MYKKFIVIMLAVMMVFTMIPMTAFGQSGPSEADFAQYLTNGKYVFNCVRPDGSEQIEGILWWDASKRSYQFLGGL